MSRILVIEDEPDIRQVLDYNLRLAGHEVSAAARGLDVRVPQSSARRQ